MESERNDVWTEKTRPSGTKQSAAASYPQPRFLSLRGNTENLEDISMKKFVSMMLSALLVLSLAACGDKNNASGDKSRSAHQCPEHTGDRMEHLR